MAGAALAARPMRRWREVGASTRSASIAHYISLVVAAVVLTLLSRNQWFDFDEWRWIQAPADELWAGHVGHWSTVPILVWMGIQAAFGLASYLPFLAPALLAHLVTGHLLWRTTRRSGGSAWIATGLSALFLLLGAGAQNIFWAFQFAYTGAIALGLAAVLLTLRVELTRWVLVAIAGCMLIGVMTAGTIIPFMVAVALILWHRAGLARAAAVLAVPTIAYAFYLGVLVGPGPQDGMRAQGIDILLTPRFAGTMLVTSIDTTIPIPQIGAAVVAALGIGVVLLLRTRRLSLSEFTATSLAGSAALFALMTGYSRWNMGLEFASSGRYVYLVFVTLAPLGALLLTRAVRRSTPALLLTLGVILVVGVYNLGLLVAGARAQAAAEGFTHEVVSGALELLDEYPAAVEMDASPDPSSLPETTLRDLSELRREYGLPVVPVSSAPARLTALAHVGVSISSVAGPEECQALSIGGILPDGAVVNTGSGADVTVIAVDDGQQGRPRTLTLDDGGWRVSVAGGTSLQVTGVSAPVEVCAGARQEGTS